MCAGGGTMEHRCPGMTLLLHSVHTEVYIRLGSATLCCEEVGAHGLLYFLKYRERKTDRDGAFPSVA